MAQFTHSPTQHAIASCVLTLSRRCAATLSRGCIPTGTCALRWSRGAVRVRYRAGVLAGNIRSYAPCSRMTNGMSLSSTILKPSAFIFCVSSGALYTASPPRTTPPSHLSRDVHS